MKNFLKLVLCIFICFLPGLIGSYFTVSNMYPWYDTIIKPDFTPPGWVFAPVWNTLFTLMGVSLFIFINRAKSTGNRNLGLVVFGIQLFLNGLWSYVFFGLHNIFASVWVIGFLLIFIFKSIIKFHRESKLAAYLLIPYLLWVSFATVININIYFLNL